MNIMYTSHDNENISLNGYPQSDSPHTLCMRWYPGTHSANTMVMYHGCLKG